MKTISFLFILCVFTLNCKAQPYNVIDSLSISIPEELKTIEEIAHFLTKNLNNEQDKARALYTWIAYNFEYLHLKTDTTFIKYPRDKAIKYFMDNKKGDCVHFSYLFDEMCSIVKLNSFFLSGYTYSGDEVSDIGHAWNAINLNDNYFLIDVTWAEGYSDIFSGEHIHLFNDSYFLIEPDTFIKDHMPIDPMYQFLTNPIDHNEFQSKDFTKIKITGNFAYKDSIKCDNTLDSLTKAKRALFRMQSLRGTHESKEIDIAFKEYLILNKEFQNNIDEYSDIIKIFNDNVDLFNTFLIQLDSVQKNAISSSNTELKQDIEEFNFYGNSFLDDCEYLNYKLLNRNESFLNNLMSQLQYLDSKKDTWDKYIEMGIVQEFSSTFHTNIKEAKVLNGHIVKLNDKIKASRLTISLLEMYCDTKQKNKEFINDIVKIDKRYKSLIDDYYSIIDKNNNTFQELNEFKGLSSFEKLSNKKDLKTQLQLFDIEFKNSVNKLYSFGKDLNSITKTINNKLDFIQKNQSVLEENFENRDINNLIKTYKSRLTYLLELSTKNNELQNLILTEKTNLNQIPSILESRLVNIQLQVDYNLQVDTYNILRKDLIRLNNQFNQSQSNLDSLVEYFNTIENRTQADVEKGIKPVLEQLDKSVNYCNEVKTGLNNLEIVLFNTRNEIEVKIPTSLDDSKNISVYSRYYELYDELHVLTESLLENNQQLLSSLNDSKKYATNLPSQFSIIDDIFILARSYEIHEIYLENNLKLIRDYSKTINKLNQKIINQEDRMNKINPEKENSILSKLNKYNTELIQLKNKINSIAEISKTNKQKFGKDFLQLESYNDEVDGVTKINNYENVWNNFSIQKNNYEILLQNCGILVSKIDKEIESISILFDKYDAIFEIIKLYNDTQDFVKNAETLSKRINDTSSKFNVIHEKRINANNSIKKCDDFKNMIIYNQPIDELIIKKLLKQIRNTIPFTYTITKDSKIALDEIEKRINIEHDWILKKKQKYIENKSEWDNYINETYLEYVGSKLIELDTYYDSENNRLSYLITLKSEYEFWLKKTTTIYSDLVTFFVDDYGVIDNLK